MTPQSGSAHRHCPTSTPPTHFSPTRSRLCRCGFAEPGSYIFSPPLGPGGLGLETGSATVIVGSVRAGFASLRFTGVPTSAASTACLHHVLGVPRLTMSWYSASVTWIPIVLDRLAGPSGGRPMTVKSTQYSLLGQANG
jgi:hypothetical protein